MTRTMNGFKAVIVTGAFLAVGATFASPSRADCPETADKTHTAHVNPAASEDCGGATTEAAAAMTQAGLEETWGIKVQGVRLSAASYILDFRFQVTDPDKAAPLLNRRFVPQLIDEATGAFLQVPVPPKVGALRQDTSTPVAGRTYFVLFSNPGKFVKKGQKIAVVIGDFKVEHIVVGG